MIQKKKPFGESLKDSMKDPKACFDCYVEVYWLTTLVFLAQSSPSSFEQYIGL